MCEVTHDPAVLQQEITQAEEAYQLLLTLNAIPVEYRNNPSLKPEDAPGISRLAASMIARARATLITMRDHLECFLAAAESGNSRAMNFAAHGIMDMT